LQESCADILGVAAGERRRPTRFYGGSAVRTVLCSEGIRPNGGFQRRLCNTLPYCRPTLYTAVRAYRQRCPDRQYFSRRGSAGLDAGQNSTAANACSPRKVRSSRPHSATFPSLARWFRSAVAGNLLVEGRL